MTTSSRLPPGPCHEALASVLGSLLGGIDCSMHASVSVEVDGVMTVIYSTDDQLDVEADISPIETAYRLGWISRVPTVHRNIEFGRFSEACRAVGISSVAAVPIKSKATVLGVLVVTSVDHHGFAADDIRTARQAAGDLASLLTSTSAAAG